jgi:HAD superfamily hydrolase (TIGR01509 family)
MNPASAIGAIFDWDGVIIDSSAAHEQSWDLLAAEEKRVLPPGHFKAGFGRKNQFIIPHILKWADAANATEIARLGARKEELYREILKTTGISALPGVRELLEGLRTAGIPCVVGSSTPRVNIEHVMTLANLHGFFADIVSAEDVSRGKPHPEVFLKAAAKINRVPAKCVVFEDAFVGLEAARAGGFKSIGVGTTNSVESLVGHCDRAVFRLSELDVADVISVIST